MKRLILTGISILFLIPLQVLAQKNILVAYHSETGNTRQMAEAVADGARSVPGVSVMLKLTAEVSESDLIRADAIIVGSPVYNAAPSPAISEFMASWPFENEPLKDKIGAAFVTGGGISAGEELVQMSLLQSMLVFGMIIVGGPDWTQPFGASAVTSEAPFMTNSYEGIHPAFLEKGRRLGERVAGLTLRFGDQNSK